MVNLYVLTLDFQAFGPLAVAVVLGVGLAVAISYFLSGRSKKGPVALDPSKKIPFKLVKREVSHR